VTSENVAKAKAHFDHSTTMGSSTMNTVTHIRAVFNNSDDEDYFKDIMSAEGR
jgi:hypothetical protein